MMLTSQSFAMDRSIQREINDIFSPKKPVFKTKQSGEPSHENSFLQETSRYSVDNDVFIPIQIDLLN